MNLFILGEIRGAYRSQRFIEAMLKNGVEKIYVSSFGKREKGFFSKILKKFSDLVMLIMSDIVYICPAQHTILFYRIAVLLKKKIILEFYLSMYDTVILDRKEYSMTSKVAEKLKKKDIYALTTATVSVFLNKSEAQYYTDVLGVDLSSINHSIIPVCVGEKKAAKLNYHHGKKDYMTICWVGTYIPLQGLDKIIRAIPLVEKKGLDVKLIIWGNSNEKAQPYEKLVNDLGVEHMVRFNNSDWGNMKKWESFIIEECDLSLGIFGDSKKAKTVVANKLLDGVAFETPVLTADSSGVYEYFSNDQIFICESTPESIASKIEEIYKLNAVEIDCRVKASKKVLDKYFSFDSFSSQFVRLVKKIDFEV